MAIGDYTIPNTTIYLLKGCPLDKDYRHTKYFTNATQQNDYFRTLVFKTFSEQTYQRYAKGQLRIAALADDIYSANYMMFQNTNHGNKWFYAFIDSIEYVSNTVTTVYYTIDVIQTWMFDYSMNGCFVEREHSLTDNFGENLVPENLETGDKIIYRREALVDNAQYMLGCIMLKRSPKENTKTTFATKTYSDNTWRFTEVLLPGDKPTFVITNLRPQVISPLNNITQGGLVYALHGIPINPEDCPSYFDSHTGEYNYFNVKYEHAATGESAGYVTLATLLRDLADGHITGYGENGDTVTLGTDDIIAVYTYPAYYALWSSLNKASNEGLNNYCGHITKSITKPTSFNYGGKIYIPKNKKTLTSPYNDIKITNAMGDEINLKYELFGDTANPDFDIYTVLYSSPCCTVVPHSYKGIIRNWDESISQSNYPTPAYSGNAYQDWLKDNRTSWTTGMIASSLNGIASTTANVIRGNIAGAVTGGISTVTNIGSSLLKTQDIKQKSPTTVYQALTQLLNLSTKEMQCWLYKTQIKPEFAKMIDNYFSMFGYATKQVKTPNVKDPSVATLLRPSWNYVQTKGCMIDAVTHKDSNGNEIVDSCVPADVERELERIYDNGITFWMPNKTVGDYTQDNSPVIT